MLIDTHVHLDNIKYQDDIDDVIKRAVEENVEKFIIPGANIADLERAVMLSEKYPQVYFSVGTHPYDIDTYNQNTLESYINHEKCVAVGECGLDYFRLPEDEDEKIQNIALQKEVFISQINLAKKYKKPLIVHVRDASDDSKEILMQHKSEDLNGVLHCYNADEQLLSLANEGFYFGIGGVLTFKNAKKLVNVLAKIPKEKLLIETDGPYLTPHPFRGQRNEPKYTNEVSQKMSELLDMSKEDIINLTGINAHKLFTL